MKRLQTLASLTKAGIASTVKMIACATWIQNHLSAPPSQTARPLVVTPGSPEISVPLGLDCVRLHILGHVTLPGGYPATGKPGEVIASYTVALAGGKMREVPLRNGVEVARSNMIHEATRTNPIAAAAPRALIFTKDVVREHYQVLLYSLTVNGRVQSITLRLKAGADPLLVFAITAERV